MSDEDTNPVETEEVIADETPQVEPTATEEPTEVEAPEKEEAPAEPEPVADEQPEEIPEPVEEPVSRRANKRIQELTRKLAEAQQHQPQRPVQRQQLINEGDYTPEEINGLAQQYGQEQYSAGLAQANALAFSTRLEIDAPKVATKYPVLDQNSDNFDPGVSAFINESYLKTVGYDPQVGSVQNNNIRYEEYVEGMMELVDTLSQGKEADSQKNLAKQAAQTGVRPSGIRKDYSGTDPSKMTLEQLQAAALLEAKAQKF